MVSSLKKLEEFEKIIGLIFNNKEYLDNALTHSSYANHKKNVKYNERLEFLGDAILELIISEFLFLNYPKKSEGKLTKIRSLIVCENSLFEISKNWQLGKYMNMSKGEELTGGRNRPSILSDCVEAIIASIYLDKGIEEIKSFILINFKDTIKKAVENRIILDYKTRLQELIQKDGNITIEYKLRKFEGPPHRRTFYIEVWIDNKLMGEGVGYSKKEGEQNAAKTALIQLESDFNE